MAHDTVYVRVPRCFFDTDDKWKSAVHTQCLTQFKPDDRYVLVLMKRWADVGRTTPALGLALFQRAMAYVSPRAQSVFATEASASAMRQAIEAASGALTLNVETQLYWLCVHATVAALGVPRRSALSQEVLQELRRILDTTEEGPVPAIDMEGAPAPDEGGEGIRGERAGAHVAFAFWQRGGRDTDVEPVCDVASACHTVRSMATGNAHTVAVPCDRTELMYLRDLLAGATVFERMAEGLPRLRGMGLKALTNAETNQSIPLLYMADVAAMLVASWSVRIIPLVIIVRDDELQRTTYIRQEVARRRATAVVVRIASGVESKWSDSDASSGLCHLVVNVGATNADATAKLLVYLSALFTEATIAPRRFRDAWHTSVDLLKTSLSSSGTVDERIQVFLPRLEAFAPTLDWSTRTVELYC